MSGRADFGDFGNHFAPGGYIIVRNPRDIETLQSATANGEFVSYIKCPYCGNRWNSAKVEGNCPTCAGALR